MPTPTICADTHGLPANCCAAPPCSLSFRTKGGTATLCGISEYTSPSTPPKKYRTQTLSGSSRACQGTDECPGGISGSSWSQNDYSGIYHFDLNNCSETNTQLVEFILAPLGHATCGAGGSPAGSSSIGSGFSPAVFVGGGVTLFAEATTASATADGICGTNGSGNLQSGSVAKALSDEDTEDDAIARANGGASSETGWTPCSTGCTTFKTLRGAGEFTLSYRTAQFAISSNGTAVGQVYNVSVTLQRRPQGTSDAYADWIVVTHQFVGNGGNYVSAWLPIPVQSGYEVQAVNCVNALA